MKKSNSLLRVLFYAFLVALFFSVTNELAFHYLGASVVLSVYVVISAICLVMIFSEKGVSR
jgi:hypothetical protein